MSRVCLSQLDSLTNQVFLLRSKAPSHLFLPVCLSVCLFVYLPPIHLSMRQSLYVCNHAGWHLLEAVCQCVTCVSSVDFFAPALPAQLFLSQHFCVFAPVFLGHSLAVWVALALPNMPPKARAPEARMVFGWGQVSGVEICTCSGPSRCLPTVCKKLRKECLYIYIYIIFFLHLDLPTLYVATRKHPMLYLGT